MKPVIATILTAALALRTKIVETQRALAGALVEREDEVLACLVAMVCDQAVFFYGPPGVAKTFVAELLLKAIEGATYYTALMPGVADPDDLFVEGISVVKIDEGGGHIRTIIEKTPGRAALVNGVLLDELFKVDDPRVLQALLDLTLSDGVRLEGRRLADQAHLVMGISNETPNSGSEFDALWARFVLRLSVKPLGADGRKRMIRIQEAAARNGGAGVVRPANPLTLQDIATLQQAAAQVDIGDDILDLIEETIDELFSQDADAFRWLKQDDRRRGLMVKALKAHALIHGRTAVSKADLVILKWMMWNHPDQIEQVEEKVKPLAATPFSEALEEIDDLLAPNGKVWRAFEKREMTCFTDAAAQINRLKDTVLPRLISQASGIELSRLEAMKNGVQRLFTGVMARISGQESEMSWDAFVQLLKS